MRFVLPNERQTVSKHKKRIKEEKVVEQPSLNLQQPKLPEQVIKSCEKKAQKVEKPSEKRKIEEVTLFNCEGIIADHFELKRRLVNTFTFKKEI